MYDPKEDALFRAKRREKMLETAFRLFSEKKIDAVSMSEIAQETGFGRKTLNRYFDSKPGLVVAVAVWSWEKFRKGNKERRIAAGFDKMTAAEMFEFYLDSFLLLYRNRRDLLRFNQFFNVYVQSENIDPETLEPYREMIDKLQDHFHSIYMRAKRDGTMRTDLPEEKIFSTTLHLMLAAVTRYAVGLLYIPEDGFDAVSELETLKEVLLWKYSTA